ncbi:MAG: aminomethyl-transferring glycine dehydrogenase subunit GcvPA [Deltaproteobacteria bacterium]|nr:aminomethyl-transferring glycine dehydrogenase subunit GcvPA [Deltaproteobacteria bacterium]
MRYLPHTRDDIEAMLKVVGAKDLEGLFSVIPEDCRRKDDMSLPEPMTEWGLADHLTTLSDMMGIRPRYRVFMGAGNYDHHIPAAVTQLLTRSEFLTSYTPYQPEVSQGTLQGIYEYQTLVCRLLGMEAANASLYDGGSALAEALLMALRITKRNRVLLSSPIHPGYRAVVKTYLEPTGYEIVELPYAEGTGLTDYRQVDGLEGVAAVAIQSPNFFGCIEDLKAIGEKVHGTGALFIVTFTEPLAFGLLKSPGSLGADIACGEGQSLGIPMSFGGPGLGMFATRMQYVRNMPGRLVGKTLDQEGRRGFVLTMATREQHIRREKATSNICTNSSLCALASAMYMAFLGRSGMRTLAQLNHDKAEYLKRAFKNEGYHLPFDAPTFNEFVVGFPQGFDATHKRLLGKGIVAGLSLSRYYPELKDHYLLCVTETITREDMDELVREIRT